MNYVERIGWGSQLPHHQVTVILQGNCSSRSHSRRQIKQHPHRPMTHMHGSGFGSLFGREVYYDAIRINNRCEALVEHIDKCMIGAAWGFVSDCHEMWGVERGTVEDSTESTMGRRLNDDFRPSHPRRSTATVPKRLDGESLIQVKDGERGW